MGGQADCFLLGVSRKETGERQRRSQQWQQWPAIRSYVYGIKLLSWKLPLMFPLDAWHHHILCPNLCTWEGGDDTRRLRVGGQWWGVRCTGDCTGNKNALLAPTSVPFTSPQVASNFLHGVTWQDPANTETSRSRISYIQPCVLWYGCDCTMTLLRYCTS